MKAVVVLKTYLLKIVQLSQLLKFDLGLTHACTDWSAGVGRTVLLSLALSLCLTYPLPSVSERSSRVIGRCSQVPAISDEVVLC